MTDFQPIPGVWYENADDENDQRYLYAPHPSGMYPWWGGNNKWLRADEVPSNLRVWFNPHPPTRTEWGTQDDEGSIVENHETDIEYALNETEQYNSQLMSRQVTEWNKADVPDGWEKP